MSRHLPRVVLVAALVTTAACTPAAPPAAPAATTVADAPEDLAAIAAARDAFMKAYGAGDAKAIGELYTENAVSEPNFQTTLKGRDAIVSSLASLFEQVAVTATLDPDETRTLGNVALDRGHYTMTVTPKAGAPATTSQGRYLVVYVKGSDGRWRVSHDIDNASMPPAAPAAAPAGDGAAKDAPRP